MKKQIEEINNSIKRGVLPDCLNFSKAPDNDIDVSKLQYNAFYKSYEFAQSKFPSGYDSIPGFENVIESCICQHTPLDEMNQRHEEAKSNIPSEK
jgi:hypothetical protein